MNYKMNATRALLKLGAFEVPPSQAVLDSAAAAAAAVQKQEADRLLDAAGEFAANDIRESAVDSVLVWAGTPDSDLEEGETKADRLIAMAVGIANEYQDGDVGADEAEVINVALNAMADFMISKGADEGDVVSLLEDGDNEAAARVSEFMAAAVGEGDDVDSFSFDGESSESVMDSILTEMQTGDVVLDAVYKKKTVIRAGKKVRINKRISGTVRLSAGQKVAIKKARLKSRSATARMRRMKSMKVRKNTIGS